MNSSIKSGLKFLGLVIFICFLMLLGIGVFVSPIFFYSNPQTKAGRKYMDSLTEKDFQVWEDRTKKYLDEYDPKADEVRAKPVPPELKQLKILRISEGSNWVSYVWAGGFDHTELHVEKLSDGQFQFTAVYSDESNRVIWPK
jgi:hypothetical protein